MKPPIIIGWMVIGAIILIIGLSRLGGLSWSSNLPKVDIFFENVNGLKTHDPVYVHGFQVGTVKNIQLQESGCLIQIELSHDLSLFSDAQAEIQIKELMTGKQVVVFPGKSGKKLNQTIIGKSTFDWASGLAKFGETFGSQKFTDFMENLQQLSKNLVSFTDSLPKDDIKPMITEIRLTLNSLRNITLDLEMQQIFSETKLTLQSVRKLSDKVQPKLEKTFSLADSSLQMLPNTLQMVQNELVEADSLMKNLRLKLALLDKPGTLAYTAFHDPNLVSKIDSTVDNFNKTLDHIRSKKIHVNLSLSPKKKTYSE